MITRRLFMGWTAGLFAIVALLPHVAHADIYMKQKQHTDAFSVMGQSQPAQDLIAEIWITESKMVTNSPQQTMLIDLDKQELTFANHETKTIMVLPLDFSKMAEKTGDNLSAADKAAFQDMVGKMMNISVLVVPTAEKKKIGAWDCTKYNQTMEMGMGKITSEIWATTDIRIDPELYAKFNAAMMAQMPGVSQNLKQIMEETKKIKGVQVLAKQTTSMMGQTFGSIFELLEFKEGRAPAAAFVIPAGYKKQSMY